MINVQKVEQIAKGSPEAAWLFGVFKERGRNMQQVSVQGLLNDLKEKGIKISREELLTVLTQLEGEKVGKILRGPRGGAKHFQFTYTKLTDLVSIAETGALPPPKPKPVKQSARRQIPADWVTMVIRLSTGLMFNLGLPRGLSKADRELIAQTVREY